MTTSYDYDLFVIGGGSGGIAAAKRTAAHGKKVALVERARWGGTCVNVGCVPKKIMWCQATMYEMMKHDAVQYGFKQPNVELDFAAFKKQRDKYILKLNTIYSGGLEKVGVTKLIGDATFVDAHTVAITKEDGSVSNVTADKILIAVGGRPDLPESTPGMDLCISSDGFFDLETLPKKAVVVGAGYIAVELAGVLNGLGVDVHLVIRKHKAIRTFDEDISDHLDSEMQRQGITIHRNTNGVAKVEKAEDGTKTVFLNSGADPIPGADIILMAAGRKPNTESLNLDKVGVELIPGKTFIKADDFQNTSTDNIFALGDVCGKVELTPMAIAAGRRLADRLFAGVNNKASYDLVPTVVFSHPTIGTCGLTEGQAIAKYGKDNIRVYKSKFPNLYYGIFAMESEDKPKTFMKLVCAGKNELVVGLHMIGMGCDEILQGFGVAMKMGCTKSDLDSCVAIHPTAAEELVTMGTWGQAPQETGAKISPLGGAPPPEPTL